MQRLKQIDDETERQTRLLADAYAEHGADPAAWRRIVERWNFSEVNDLIERHNRWYPVEARLPMDPRTRDYVKVGGRLLPPRAARPGVDPRALPLHCVAVSEHDHDHEHDHEHDHDHDGEPGEDARAEAEADARRRFALAQIRQYGDPALRLVAHEVVEFDDDLRRLVERMTTLMHDAQGVGLAATQVGVLRRLFVFEPDDDGPRVIVNPVIVERADETETDEEGCLSLQGVRVPVERSVEVTIEGKDAERQRRSLGARRLRRPRRAARARPPRRRADHRPHRRRAPQRGARDAAAPRRPALMRIGVAATAPLGADVLERLAETHEVAWLLTRPDAPRGRGRKLAAPPAKEVALRLGIPVHQPEKPELPADVERGRRLRLRPLHPAARCSSARSG